MSPWASAPQAIALTNLGYGRIDFGQITFWDNVEALRTYLLAARLAFCATFAGALHELRAGLRASSRWKTLSLPT
jgi:hypothetical protein